MLNTEISLVKIMMSGLKFHYSFVILKISLERAELKIQNEFENIILVLTFMD